MIRGCHRLACLLIAPILLLAACRPAAQQEPITPERRDLVVNEQLAAMQERMSLLDRRLNEVRAEQDRMMAETVALSRQLNEELLALRRQLAAAPADAANQPVLVAPAPPAEPLPADDVASLRRNLPFVILALVILAIAIVVIVKLLMGNRVEEETLDSGETIYHTNEGSIHIAPNAAAPQPAPEDLPPAEEDQPIDMNPPPPTSEDNQRGPGSGI